jgi:hypothetical protein
MPHLTYFFLKQHLFYDWSIALAREGNETEITKETGDWRCKSYKSHKNYQGIAYCNLSHHGQAVHAQKGGETAPVRGRSHRVSVVYLCNNTSGREQGG